MALHDEARALYERGEYRAAVTKLEAALELDPDGSELVYNLALIHERLAEVDEAEHYYRLYLEMEQDPKIRERVEAVLRRLEGAKKDLAPPPSAAVTTPPPLLTAATPTPPPTVLVRPVKPAVIVTSGIAAGSLLVSGLFAITASLKNPGTSASTGEGTSYEDLASQARSAHRHAVVADVTLVIAALASASALYLYFSTSKVPRPVGNASPMAAWWSPSHPSSARPSSPLTLRF